MTPLENAIQLQKTPTPEGLEINVYNVGELIRTINELNKQLYERQRDIDVLYFELQNYKPDTQNEPEPEHDTYHDSIDIF